MKRRVVWYGLLDEPQSDGRVFKTTSVSMDCGHVKRVHGAKTDEEVEFRDSAMDGNATWFEECSMCNPQPK